MRKSRFVGGNKKFRVQSLRLWKENTPTPEVTKSGVSTEAFLSKEKELE